MTMTVTEDLCWIFIHKQKNALNMMKFIADVYIRDFHLICTIVYFM